MVDLSPIWTSLGGFKSGLAGATAYAWVLWIFVPLAIIVFVGAIWKALHDKKKQWTHKLRLRKVLVNGTLTPELVIKMRRFPLIHNATVFELEKPVLGGWLIPELDSYTGMNEFSIIINKNNRIFVSTGEFFIPEKSSVNISAKHAGIDLAFDGLKTDWQSINKGKKALEWSQIAKFAMIGLLIIASMVVMIKGIEQWGKNNEYSSNKAQAEAQAMEKLAEALKTSEATMNTQVLILDLFKEIYGTKNIQAIIREKTNATIS
jgi:uncharacterized membrane protein